MIGGDSITKSGARADMTNMMLHAEFESRMVSGIPAEPDLDDVARIIEVLEPTESPQWNPSYSSVWREDSGLLVGGGERVLWCENE